MASTTAFSGLQKRLFKTALFTAKSSVALAQKALYLLSFGEFPPFVSTSVLLQKDNQVLVIDRTDGKGLGLPGGFIRLYEKAEDAARREAREETGLEVEIREVFAVLSGKRRGTRLGTVEIVYRARITGGRIRDSIEGQCRWVDIDTAPGRMAFDYADVLEKIARGPH